MFLYAWLLGLGFVLGFLGKVIGFVGWLDKGFIYI